MFLFLDKEEQIPSGYEKKISFTAFLGILPILCKHFLVFVEMCEKVCSIESKDIYELKKIAMVQFETE